MISFVHALPVGNAMRLLLTPPAGAKRWKLLRKDADDFSGHDDAQALLVHDGDDRSVLDVAGLYNDVTVFYRAFYLVANKWLASATAQGRAGATFTDLSVDVATLVRNRLELGLREYVARGQLLHPYGQVPVMTSSPLSEEVALPVVTVHVGQDASQERFIGDLFSQDWQEDDEDGLGNWHETEGWLSRWQVVVVGWSLNGDERNALRRAIKAVLMANIPVFHEAGMEQIDLQVSDTEDLESFKAPIYMANCNLTCLAPSLVDAVAPAIRDVVVTNRN